MINDTNSSVKYRPGRIQTLDTDQEIILKQTWAYLLKYWGYEVNIPTDELVFKESFVSSSSPLVRIGTHNSTNSNKSSIKTNATSKRKKKFFGRKTTSDTLDGPPSNSIRIKQIQTSSSANLYKPITRASESIRNIFIHKYQSGFVYSKDYVSDDENTTQASNMNSDIVSLDSFVTANTSVTGFDEDSLEPSMVTKSNEPKCAWPGPQQRTLATSDIHFKPHHSILPCLSKHKADLLHDAFFSAIRNELLDNYVLRFVRARKFDSERAIEMLTTSLKWRHSNFTADDWLNDGDAPSYLSGENKGFIKNYTTEKSTIRGRDRHGNPIFMFQARKNFASDSPLAETQRFAVVTIEWCKLFFKDVTESLDQATVVFDLSGFALKNADNATVKFLAEVFEAHYPESLGSILIHNAPWIFSTIWNIIKNWLDPVVASKIHFTKNYNELSHFIAPEHIPKELGGLDDYDSSYPTPRKGDDKPPLSKDSTFKTLSLERDDLFLLFIETTIKWIESTNFETSAKYLQDKIDLSTRLSNNYIALDGYIRVPGIYDRNGSLKLQN